MKTGILLVALLFIAGGLWSARSLHVALQTGVIKVPRPAHPIRRAKNPKLFRVAIFSELVGSAFLIAVGLGIGYLAITGTI